MLAMAALLAHALAIHLGEARNFGVTYDSAHVAFRLARNLVREGDLTWNVGHSGAARGGLGNYPSPLWVGLAAVTEVRWMYVTRLAQLIGEVRLLRLRGQDRGRERR